MPSRRILLPILAAFGMIALSACVTQRNVPLPPNVAIVTPDAGVPAVQAAFVGKWEGSWDGRQSARLVVEQVLPGDRAEIIYAWGQFGTVAPDFRRFVATFDGATLVFDARDIQATYQFKLRPDDKLEARYTWSGGFSKGLFIRSPDKAR